MLRRYETIFIVRTDLQSDETGDLIGRYTGIIEGMDGTIVKVENWGKRRLAYPIEKRREGVYVRIDFVAQYRVVSEVERNFKIDEYILRFQTVKLSDKVDMEEIEREMADARKKEEEQEKEEARKREEARKEEEAQKEEGPKEEAVSEPVREEGVVSEDPDSQDAKADVKESAQETSPVEADEERAKEE